MRFKTPLVLCIATICMMRPSYALDIPMKEALAEAVLDSKTCYSTLYHRKRLMGYEMSAMMYVSKNARLITLNATGQFDIGDRKHRKYEGDRIRIEILPISSRRFGSGEVYEIKEKAEAIIVEEGRCRHLQIKVHLRCSP
jgi:hypothetical protein